MVKTVNSIEVYIKMSKTGKTVFIEKSKISAKQFRQLLYKKEVVIVEKVSTNCGTKPKPNRSSAGNSDSDSESKPKNKTFLNLRSKSLVRQTAKETTKRRERIEVHYKILGIRRNASIEEVRRAHLRLAKRHHPDRHSSEPLIVKQRHENLLKVVNNSYDRLLEQMDTIGKQSKQCVNTTKLTQDINPCYKPRNFIWFKQFM